jgi:formate transporter
MAYRTPQEIALAAVESGTAKSGLTPDRMIVSGFLAGAYIAFGALLDLVVTAGCPRPGAGSRRCSAARCSASG